MSYWPPRYDTTLQLYTVGKILSIMNTKYFDKDNRIYYKYKRNDKEEDDDYYFTNSEGNYIDTPSKDKYSDMGPEDQERARARASEHEETFFNSLIDLKKYYELYKNELNEKALKINDKGFVNIYQHSDTIRRLSPTKLEKDKHITLYDSVYIDVRKEHPYKQDEEEEKEHPYKQEEEEEVSGGKRISKGKSNKVAKKPVVSQKKQSVYKEIFGKQMKIYKMPDSRKEYVKYKGELHPISEYKSLMKQKALAKPKSKK